MTEEARGSDPESAGWTSSDDVKGGYRGKDASLVLSLARRLFFPAISPGHLSILIYHRVLPDVDPMRGFEVDASTFDAQMAVLARHFTPLSMTEALRRLEENRLPARSVCVTFDDGYADNFITALPILRRWGVPAAFFVTTAYLEGGMMWGDIIIESVRHATGDRLDLRAMGLDVYPIGTNADRAASALAILLRARYFRPEARRELARGVSEMASAVMPSRLMMTPAQIRGLRSAGMEIGGHTVNHPILTQVSDAEGWSEITQNKEQLESILGEPIQWFAYPNGGPGKDYDRRHIEMVRRAGYGAAVSTAWGVVSRRVDRYQLPRVMPWDRTATRFGLRLLYSYAQRATVLE